MKHSIQNRFLASLLFGFGLLPSAGLSDTITASATARILAGNGELNDQGALSLYNVGGNIQRSWLNFDLSAYSGKAMVGDVTMTLQAGIYGDSLTGVQLGSANAPWTAGGVTWNNQPGLTIIPGVTNPNGTFGSGAVTWTIPGYAIEKWATSGYNGIGLISAAGSTQHFYSLANGNSANHPSLTLTAADGADGTWSGASGNWTDGANWSSASVAQGINRSASIHGGSAVTITMDSTRSVGSLSFSNANHVIASGAGKLALVSSSGTPSITVAGSSNATIAAEVLGMDGLAKLGAGTLTLSGVANYSGTTTVSSGTLSLAGANSLPTTGPVAIAAGAKLSNDAAANTSFNIGAISLSGGELAATSAPNSNLGNYHLKGDVTVTGSAMSTISADVRVIQNDNRTFNVASTGAPGGVDLLVSGKLGHYNGNSWGYATKTGAGTMSLSATPEIGSITVNQGKLMLQDAGAAWQVSNGGLINNAQVELSVSSGSRSNTVPISGSGSLTKTGSGTLSLSSSGMSGSSVNSYTGGTIINGGTLEIYGRSADNGGFTSLGTGPVTVNNGATLVSANDWTTGNEWNGGNVGLITINAGGTWTINSAGGTVRNGLVLNGGTINGSGANADWGGMYLKSTSVTVGGNAVSTISVDTALDSTITMSVDAGSQLNYNGTLHNKIGAAGGISKAGEGTMTISGNHSYTGPTLVTNGTLVINGNISTSSTTVQSGGVLGGSGTVGSLIVLSGGELAPGSSPGVLSASTLSLNSGSLTTLEIDGLTRGTGYDGLNVSGAVTYGGTLAFDFGSLFVTGSHVFDLFNFGSESGDFSAVSLGGLYSGSLSFDSGDLWSLTSGNNTWSFSQSTGDLTLTVVPEPGAALLGGLGLLALLRRRRH
jgi:MYXO-CTERM domain-containing protein